MDIFIEGLEVYGHHGVTDEEKVLGQRLLYDVRLTMDECDAAYRATPCWSALPG